MRFRFLAALPLLLAASDPPFQADPPTPFQVDHPWARASAGNARNGAVFLTLTGKGAPDRLTGVSSPAAESADLHESIDDKGVMKMRPAAGLDLPPGKPVTLAPGGYHVMLMGLKAPLKTGDTFPLTLRFEHAPAMTVTVTVEAIGGGGHHHH